MEELIQSLNDSFVKTLGINFLEPMEFISLFVRFIITLVVVCIITRCFYYPHSRRRDYMFIFIIMAMSIFLLVSLMGNGLDTGAALGLFAIFGIMRFRTEAIPIREMTYLFMLVSLSVINAMVRYEFHRKHGGYHEGIGLMTLIVSNLIFIGLAWMFESSKILNEHCSKYINYDNVALVTPERRGELIADLEKRTGLKILQVEVGTIDFLKDSVILRIFYDEDSDKGSSIQEMGRLPKLK